MFTSYLLYIASMGCVPSKNMTQYIPTYHSSLFEFQLSFVIRRYKIVVTVTMGERYMQGLKSIAQFLWDPEKDSYVSCIYDSSPSLFAVATIYAIYFDWER